MYRYPEYSQDADYKAIMEYDPQIERVQMLEQQLLEMQIELAFAKIRSKMFEDMYNNIESISHIV